MMKKEDKQSEFQDLLTDEPITSGIFLRRFPDGLETNVPHFVVKHSSKGYEWGFDGSGPADLALNILENVLIAMCHQGPR